ncbi:chalcone isomerase family protein [bacterium]|nr:chalcone isomerase family protein [bacterium]MBP5590289.1 chalcone isomerase family protein [bacterium]
MRKFISLIIVFCLTFPVFAAKVKYDPEIKVDENLTIPLRNYGVFAPASFSIYAIGLYVGGTETANMKLKDADVPMAIRLVSLSNLLGMNKLISELRRGFSYGMSHDKEFLKTIQTRIDTFLDMLKNSGKNPKKNKHITFLYLPDKGTKVYFEDEFLGEIKGHDFKRALFGIWLNSNCADPKLRDEVVRIRKK